MQLNVCFSFYAGAFGIIWAISWTIISYESPSKHPTISEAEKIYIETKIMENTSMLPNKVQEYISYNTSIHPSVSSVLNVYMKPYVMMLHEICLLYSL